MSLRHGLISHKDALKICERVCDTLGDGQNVVFMLLGTMAVETRCGAARDTNLTTNKGVGLMQFDQIGFDDVKARTKSHIIEKFENEFGIDWDSLTIDDLRYSPVISVIFARCFYLLKKGAIPETVQARALYWKKFYNTVKGKGTADHYVSTCWEVLPKISSTWARMAE